MDKVMKLWSFYLNVKVLEFEFSTPKLIFAETSKQAYHLAREYAKDYYGEGGKESFDDSTFSFNGGCPIVEFSYPVEVSQDKWLNMALDRALITKKPLSATG